MANSKWRDVIVNSVTSLELARTVCWRLHIVMEEGYLDALFGCEQLFEAETQLSPIIGTGGQYLFSNPSACISETTDLDLLRCTKAWHATCGTSCYCYAPTVYITGLIM